MHTHAINQIAEIQDECRAESPKTARAILRSYFPHKSDSFFKRNLQRILALSPDDLARVIGYPDPTGEKAVRNVLAVAA